VGLDTLARRQAKLAMRAYPNLSKAEEMGVTERVAYLDRCVQLFGQAEEAWTELAKMARDGELNEMNTVASARLATLTKTFAQCPDFLARLSDDLLTPETSSAAKIRHYTRVVGMYDKAGRPDLSCNVRLKIAQLQEEAKQYQAAAQTLTLAVRKFPAEGRYIPGLLKAYEKVCENYPAGIKPLGNLYLELGPALVLHYRGDSNKFLDKVLAQATSFYEEKSLSKQGTVFQNRVAQAKARAKAMKK
jgi:hypothetical protein